MREALTKLISISSAPICSSPPSRLTRPTSVDADPRLRQLEWMLKKKNGFYTFESALHVFPSGSVDSEISLEQWNDESLWKNCFRRDLNDVLFFAEDLFGGQFGIKGSKIIRFEPETSEIDFFSEDLNGWAIKILENYDYETGYSLAAEWQRRNGPISKGKRLLPKIPFVLGGQYEVENLNAIECVEGMRFRADICRQIKDLPDGTRVEIKLTD